MIYSSSQYLKFHVLVFSLTGFGFSYIRFSWIDRIKISLHGLMYIRIDLYTSMLHILRKTYFDKSIHVFGVLYLNKTYFWISYQKHRYKSLYVYWILSIYNMLQSCFNIMFLYLHVFWRKQFSISKNPSFGKYSFWFKAKFQDHKNGWNSLKYVLNLCHIYLYFKDIIRTDFLCVFMGFN